ncbi:aldo/keto reductase [Vibrio sp. SCSIO 43137]|uniref:aldo/keto reductase n=1 Tax=Vibrio sp. SCSIO 43137 TaxID=3021011 RepID=UPI002307F176|nr:aldo/keto reductase [Vibrio sp. SCSIO 43137]WCE31355.1 aldo/keto reductase [Vibrio sp. SCSIO 43137]
MNKHKPLPISSTLPEASRIAYGCMGLGGSWNSDPLTTSDIVQAKGVIEAALESGINFFDHADIYTRGKAEQAFGQVIKQSPELREQMIIQSKCAIRFEDESAPGRYDFSADWVTESVNGILSRLNIEKLDVLLLHRPDPLAEMDELAEALRTLQSDGKFDHLGVSNMNLYQMQFLEHEVGIPVVVNQLEMSLAKLDWLDQGVMFNSAGNNSNDFMSGTLEYCQMQGVQLQAWGCLAQGKFAAKGLESETESVRNTARYVQQLAEKYSVGTEAIVLAFLLRHPANIQPVIGTTNIERIKSSAQAVSVNLTREEWYSLYVASRGVRLP